MATFEITGPDGNRYRVQGETEQGALTALQKHLGVSPPPAPVATQGHDGVLDGVSRAVSDGFFMGFSDNIGAGMAAVLGGNPESMEWFDYDDSGGYGLGGMRQRYDQNLALERQKRDAFAEEYPITDTTAKIGGGVLGAVTGAAAAPVRAATSGAGRAAQAAGGGAVVGGVTAVGDADGEATPLTVAGGGAAGALGGLAGIPVSALASRSVKMFGRAGRGIARVFAKPETFDRATGQITEEGRRRLISQDVDPERITMQLQEAFAIEAGDSAGTAAGKLGIPLTKGQASGEVPQIASEEAMRAGARGQGAYDVMRGFDQRQGAAVSGARGRVSDDLAPNVEADAVDTGQMVMDGVRREAETAKAAAQQAYATFEEMGGGIKGEAAQGFMNRVAQRFAREDIVPEAGMSNTTQALKLVNRMMEGAERGAIPFKRLETTRQRLNQLSRASVRGSDGGDQMAMRELLGEYDEWLEDSVVNIITDGTPEAMQKVREARKLWSAYTRTFAGREGPDNTIRKIVEDDLSPDQVMGWLIGSSAKIGGGATAKTVNRLRDVLGADSREFMALKKAAFDRMTTKAGDMIGPDAMFANLGEFLEGKGKALSAELFTPDELGRIREFRSAVGALKKPQKATNPSGSGYEVQRGVMALWQGLGGALGFATGGPGGAIGGTMAARGASDFSNKLAAKAATAGISGSAPSLAAAIGGGGVAGGQAPAAAESALGN